MKLNYEGIWASVLKYKIYFIIGGLAVVLIAVALWMTDCGSNWSFRRDVKKDKAAIANQMDQAKEVKGEIANLQNVNAQIQANINADTNALAAQTFGREEVKKEVNAALANYQKAVAANTNVDRTAADLQRQLERLDGQ